MTPEEIADGWARLPTPTTVEHLEANEASPESAVWLAVDHVGQQHLLVRVPDQTEAPPARTKGLSVSVRRHRVPGQPDADYIDLACVDDAAAETFAVVAADLVNDLHGIELDGRSATVSDTLARWRWFWGDTSSRLSEKEAVGLFAELWFLDQWAGALPETVEAWGGSDNTRHDFQWPGYSVEVKATATRGDGATIHTVQHLDQLADPETGQLYLFSMRVVRDRLAANSLAALIRRASMQLAGNPLARDSFLSKVAQRGYNPADRTLRESSYRILEERLYEVSGSFPRLTEASFPTGVPTGVVDVSYKIDMSTCEEWLAADGPSGWHPHGS
jgi:Putative  PD-(D/E)XK family member, (DUF4420)